MSLNIGTRIGSYEITASIGAGGMGEVYRARDTSLNRDVAIKILPANVASDPDRLARFRREAEVLAAFSHQNIAHVYGVESSAAGPALVMEFIDGRTLDELIAGREVPWDDALPIARQIADALECAHERGIVHRDLKPANVKITDSGVVKVLDFGLAKAVNNEMPASDVANSPTLTARATAMGVILGTAAYMAPEQTKGRPVDRRADIWAFGAVLYEMLAGRRAFGGDDVTEVLAAVIKTEPDWSALPGETPAAAVRLLRRCLEKDPKRRLRDIADGLIQLDEELGRSAIGVAAPESARRSPWRRAVPVSVAVLVTALAVSAAWMSNQTPVSIEPARMSLRPDGLLLSQNPRPHIVLMRDGSIVYRVGGRGLRDHLVVKRTDQFNGQALDGGHTATTPFVSPDGQWLGFIHGSPPDDLLFKIPVRGGPRTLIAKSPVDRIYGATWAPDDSIVFGTAQGLFRIQAGSDNPVPLTKSEGENTGWHAWPSVVGSMDLVVFAIRRGEESTLAAAKISTGAITPLRVPGSAPRYLPTGHIAYATPDGVLRVVPFDASRVAVTGPPIPMETGLYVSSASGAAEFDVSESGTLVYIAAEQELRTMVWVDRQGRETAIAAEAGQYSYPRVSRDDSRLSVMSRGRELDILSWEFKQPGLRPLVRNTDIVGSVLWADDGTFFYSMRRDGRTAVFRHNADGTGQPTEIVASDESVYPVAVLNNSELVVRKTDEIGIVRLSGDRQIEILLSGVNNPSLSPDGAYLAYESREPREVLVKPFPRVNDGGWQIASGIGFAPVFSRDGREVFYLTRDNLMSARIVPGRSFAVETPKVVFPAQGFFSAGLGRSYDVASDGRFLMLKSAGRPQPAIHVVSNWFTEVVARVKSR